MRVSVHGLQVRIDGIKELPTRGPQALCEQHQGGQGRDALAGFNRADEAACEGVTQISLRYAQGDPSAPDLKAEAAPSRLVEVWFSNT